jgi:mannitol/fructose-specific phosphotransferase system IIA component (Ntr-type)
MKDNVTLADFTAPGLVMLCLRGDDAPCVIQELSQALAREGRVPDFSAFCQAVLKRERLVNTNMEPAMAFPHARLSNLPELSFALGRSDSPLPWGATAPPNVRLIFLLAVPENESSQYLQLISGLARLSKEKSLVQALLGARDETQIISTLQQMPLRTRSRPQPLPLKTV